MLINERFKSDTCSSRMTIKSTYAHTQKYSKAAMRLTLLRYSPDGATGWTYYNDIGVTTTGVQGYRCTPKETLYFFYPIFLGGAECTPKVT